MESNRNGLPSASLLELDALSLTRILFISISYACRILSYRADGQDDAYRRLAQCLLFILLRVVEPRISPPHRYFDSSEFRFWTMDWRAAINLPDQRRSNLQFGPDRVF